MLGTSALSQAPGYSISPHPAVRGNARNIRIETGSRLFHLPTMSCKRQCWEHLHWARFQAIPFPHHELSEAMLGTCALSQAPGYLISPQSIRGLGLTYPIAVFDARSHFICQLRLFHFLEPYLCHPHLPLGNSICTALWIISCTTNTCFLSKIITWYVWWKNILCLLLKIDCFLIQCIFIIFSLPLVSPPSHPLDSPFLPFREWVGSWCLRLLWGSHILLQYEKNKCFHVHFCLFRGLLRSPFCPQTS